MQMIQNVMMQDAAPAVLPQMSKGGPAAPAVADGAGSFAQVLQGSQANRTEAAVAADPQEAGATTRGAWLRLVNAYGTPVSATGGDSKGAQAGSATPAADAKEEAAATPVDDLAKALETALAQQLGAGANGPAIPAAATGNRQRGSLTAPQQTEAADNPQAAVLADAAQQPSACPDSKSTEQPVLGSENATVDVKDLTTEAQAQQQAALLMAAAAQAANVAVQQPRELRNNLQQAEPEATPQGVEPGAAVAVQQNASAAAALQPAASADTTAPILAAALQQQGSAALAQDQPAAQTPSDSSTGTASGTAGAASAAQQGEIKVVKQGPGSQSQALDALRAAGPAVHPEVSQKAETAGTTVSPATNGAPEKEPRLAATSERQTSAASEQMNTPKADAPAVPAQAAPTSERAASPAEVKGARPAQAFHGTYSEMRGVTERNAATQEAAVPEGTGGTQAAPAARVTVLTGSSAGQEGSGEQEQKGHPEQKAQANQSAAATLQAPELKAQGGVESQPAGEPKSAHLKELHESILSQVKDGVVTHDGKGNGQLSIRLNPGELGELKIQVRMDDNRVRVEVQADNKMVKDLLMSNLDSLKDSLTSKNFSMEGFDVSTGGGFNSPLNEQQGDAQQQRAWVRTARAGGYGDQPEPARVNYVTEEVNTLLDVRF